MVNPVSHRCDYLLRPSKKCNERGAIPVKIVGMEQAAYCDNHIFKLFMSDNDRMVIRRISGQLYADFLREGVIDPMIPTTVRNG